MWQEGSVARVMPAVRLGCIVLAFTAAGAGVAAAPLAIPHFVDSQESRRIEKAQYVYLGKPYCWYHYGWAGPGWYRCGYGTRTGLGWGGRYGWHGWEVPRTYRALPAVPGFRFRHYD
jgi:hypothetical protein